MECLGLQGVKMPKFHETLDDMEEGLQELNYTIQNPNEPFVEWYRDIIISVGKINFAASQMRESELDLDKLERELFKFYGENSDGTYKDFEISKVKKSMRQYFKDENYGLDD